MGEAGELSGGESAAAGGGPASRGAPRLAYEAVVRLRCDGRRGIHTGFVRDISRGGMFLRLVDPEPPGKRLGFELYLPGWRFPARGIGEVAWQRVGYEGPGRPPGMAVRFVALEAMAIDMLAAVLPDGAAPVVEVLARRPLPVMEKAEQPSSTPPPAASDVAALSLEELIAEAGIAPPLSAPLLPPFGEADEIDELAEPMIFVPPPPLPVPDLPRTEVAPAPLPAPSAPQPGWPPLRWGSPAAGIAAVAALATLGIVGAARREVVVAAPPAVTAQSAAVQAVSVAPEPAPAAVAPASLRVEPATSRAASNANAAAMPANAPLPGALPLPPAGIPVNGSADLTAPAGSLRAGAIAARLTDVRWEPLAAGGTRLVVAVDSPLVSDRVAVSRIGGESPRLVVRLIGVATGVRRGPWEPATAEVRRVRAGRHDGAAGGELHLVLDLAAADVRLAGREIVGGELRLDLAPSP